MDNLEQVALTDETMGGAGEVLSVAGLVSFQCKIL